MNAEWWTVDDIYTTHAAAAAAVCWQTYGLTRCSTVIIVGWKVLHDTDVQYTI